MGQGFFINSCEVNSYEDDMPGGTLYNFAVCRGYGGYFDAGRGTYPTLLTP